MNYIDDDVQEKSSEVTPLNEKLTEWKKPPKLADLKQDLMDAQPIHNAQMTKIKTWLENLNVEGKAKVSTTGNGSKIVPKLIRKQAEWRYSALSEAFLSTDEVFKVKPMTWEDRKAAKQNQLLLNQQLNTCIDKVKFIDEYVRAAVDEGTVILRTGWKFEEEEVTESEPIVEYRVNPEMEPMHQQLAQLEAESPSEFDTDVPEELKIAYQMTIEQGVPIEPVITGHRQVKKMKTTKNHPTVEICNVNNVVIDPSCLGDIIKASFAVYSFESSLSELKKNPRYKNLDHVVPSMNSPLAQPDHAPSTGLSNFNFNDEPRKKMVVYEYWGFWDIDDTGIVKPIVVTWVGDVCIRMEESPFPDKELPFILEHYLPVRKSSYGEPDGALLEDNQKIIGAVTRGMIDLMGKSANGQTGMRKDMLDVTNRRKFDKGQDYEFNQNVDPRQGVHMHTYPEIPQSAQFMLQLQNMEAESLTGVKSYANSGISGSGLGDVAAGVRGALDAASKRELAILRRLSNGIIKVGRKFISMNAAFLSDEETVRITNEEFIKVRRDDLAGNFDLKLSISTPEEDNNKAQELAFMLQTIGNDMDQDMRKMILSDIATLRKMPELAKKIEMYQPQPDPLLQEQRMLENELLKAKIQVELAKAEHFRSGAGLAQAKGITEGAKASNLSSDTDIKNLDFVEQESGVKQERDLQKQSAQAKAQAELKVVSHALDTKKELLKQYLLNKNKK
jgi:hypothetical protein